MTNDNEKGFFNWQGNNLTYTYIGNYTVVAVIILTLILGFIFKNRISSYFIRKENQKILIWRNIDVFLQTIGIVMIIIWVFRIIILVIHNYPIYYEHIGLHLCRFHFILTSLFLAFRKKEWMRYILYLSFLASIIGILFGATKNDLVKTDNVFSKDNIFSEKGFTYYNAGIDTHYYWDYHLTHLLTGVLPIIISIGINKKVTTLEFYRIVSFYYLLGFLLFGINFVTDFIDDKGWRANYWYMGRDRNNQFKNFLSPLTKWPQNLFFYLSTWLLYVYIFHFVFLAVIGPWKENLIQFIKEHNKKTFRQVLYFKNN